MDTKITINESNPLINRGCIATERWRIGGYSVSNGTIISILLLVASPIGICVTQSLLLQTLFWAIGLATSMAVVAMTYQSIESNNYRWVTCGLIWLSWLGYNILIMVLGGINNE